MTEQEEKIIRKYLGDVWLAWDGEAQPLDGASFTVYRKDEWGVCAECDYLATRDELDNDDGVCNPCASLCVNCSEPLSDGGGCDACSFE